MDWPAYRSIVVDEINVALSNVRFKPGQDPGAPRAIGRRLLADSNAYLLTGDENAWNQLVLWHASNAHSKSVLGQETNPSAFNFMRVQDVYSGDKPPFLCSGSLNCQWNVDSPIPSIIGWQHGLLLKGLVASWNVLLYRTSLGLPNQGTGPADLETHIAELATTLVRHNYQQAADGTWQTWNLIKWDGGQPIDTAILSDTSSTAGYTHDRVTVDNGWWDWHFAGLYYLAKANHGIALPSDVVTKLIALAAETDAMLSDSSIERREWYPFTQ